MEDPAEGNDPTGHEFGTGTGTDGAYDLDEESGYYKSTANRVVVTETADGYELMYGPFTTDDEGATWRPSTDTDTEGTCGLYYLDGDGNKVAVTLYTYNSTGQTWTPVETDSFDFTATCDSTDLVNGKALVATITCPVCGQEIDVYAAPEHTITTATDTVEATCGHGGYVVGECAICKEAEVTMWTGNSTAHDFIEYVLEVDEEKNVYVVTGLCSYCGGWEHVSEGTLYNAGYEVSHDTGSEGLITDNKAKLKVGVYAEGDYDPETKTLADEAEDCWDSSANDNAGAYTLPTYLNAGWRVYAYAYTITAGDENTTYYAYDAVYLSRTDFVLLGADGTPYSYGCDGGDTEYVLAHLVEEKMRCFSFARLISVVTI